MAFSAVSWRLLASPGASWNVLGCPGASWLILACPGVSWRVVASLGVSLRLLALAGVFWRRLACAGDTMAYLTHIVASISAHYSVGGATAGTISVDIDIVLRLHVFLME